MRNDNEYQKVAKPLSKYMHFQYPNVLFHYDLAGNNLSIIQAAKMKAIQYPNLKMPDFQILQGNCRYIGLFLELKYDEIRKKDGSLKSNEHIEKQYATILRLRERGYYADFAVGLRDAIAKIDEYLKVSTR